MTFLEKHKLKLLPSRMTLQLEDLLLEEIESMSNSYIEKILNDDLSDKVFEEIKEYSQLSDKLIKHRIVQKYKIADITSSCDKLAEKFKKLKYSVEFNSFDKIVTVSEGNFEQKFKLESLFFILNYLLGDDYDKKDLFFAYLVFRNNYDDFKSVSSLYYKIKFLEKNNS